MRRTTVIKVSGKGPCLDYKIHEQKWESLWVNLILKMNELTLEIYPFNMKKYDLSGTAKDEIS